MTPTTKRRMLLVALVAIPGCAVFVPNDPGWETKPSHAPLPAYFVDVDGVTLQKLCGPRADFTYNGCAIRNYALNRCTIYVEPNAPDWLATHELAHCAGLDHERQ